MKRFTRLYLALGETTRINEKVAALRDYFMAAPPRDAAWALFFLTGRRILRGVTTRTLRDWVAQETKLPPWLVDESYHAVGDLSETLALLLGEPSAPTDAPLHEVIEDRLLPLRQLPEEKRREIIVRTWREFDADARLVFHKLMTGEFRVGVQRKLVVRALADLAGLNAAVMDHRIMARWEPTEADYTRLLGGETGVSDPGHPYPFFLASPLEAGPATLGEPADWQAEWKWDGIRAQLIHRHGQVLLWSRGEELIAHAYPEIAQAGRGLPAGTVLDGEIMAWQGGRPLAFAELQKRIGRKNVAATLFDAEVPVVFMAYDLLEADGADARMWPLAERRARLAGIVGEPAPSDPLRLSPTVAFASWEELAESRIEARDRRVEGLMLKRRASAYGVGRVRGDWWKWKIDPFSVDAVLIYAQSGHGRRAGLFTDYTFGVWDRGELVPVTKAYSGLTDAEIHEVDAFVRRNSTAKHGPVRVVEPVHVFEVAFEAIQASPRHKSGIALRFPRMARWRRDKRPQDADTLDALRALLSQQQRGA